MSVLSKIFSNFANTSIFFDKKSKEPESVLNKFNIMNALGVIVYTSLEDKEVKYSNKAFSLEYEGNHEILDSNSLEPLKFESPMIVSANTENDIQLTLENLIKEYLNSMEDLENGTDEEDNDGGNPSNLDTSKDEEDTTEGSNEQESPKVHQLNQSSAHQGFERGLDNDYNVLLSFVMTLSISEIKYLYDNYYSSFDLLFDNFDYYDFFSAISETNPLIAKSFTVSFPEDSIETGSIYIQMLNNIQGGVGPYTVIISDTAGPASSAYGVNISLATDGSQDVVYEAYPLLHNFPTATVKTDSFEYTIVDSIGQMSSGVVTVDVTPVVDMPTLIVNNEIDFQFDDYFNPSTKNIFIQLVEDFHLNDPDGSEQIFLNIDIEGNDDLPEEFNFIFTNYQYTAQFSDQIIDGDAWTSGTEHFSSEELSVLKLNIYWMDMSDLVQTYNDKLAGTELTINFTATSQERDLGAPGLTTPVETVVINFEEWIDE